MSAVLVHNNKKYNELEDGWESCLHVLTWMALRFTKHTCSEGVKGGDIKRGFLATHEIPCVVRFDHRPHLKTLIKELTQTLAVRYEEPPSAEQINQLQCLRDKGLIDEELGNGSVVLNYEKRMVFLKSPDWLVHTFERHLTADSWPWSDKAQARLIGTEFSKKRVREQGKLEVQILGAKAQRRSNGSSSCSRL